MKIFSDDEQSFSTINNRESNHPIGTNLRILSPRENPDGTIRNTISSTVEQMASDRPNDRSASSSKGFFDRNKFAGVS